MKKYKRFILFLPVIILFLAGFKNDVFQDPESNLIRSISSKIENFQNLYPQQKAYLHIDKDRYTIEDKLWFKAYVVGASDHIPDNQSSNLFVELINPEGYLVQAKRILLENGYGNGNFSFQDTVTEGMYLIRAYTNWMRNLGDDFFFTRQIYIENPLFADYATREEIQRIKKSFRKAENKAAEYDISFHPEGGNLLAGIENRVVFKAINKLGKSIELEGELHDGKGNVLLNVQTKHGGMGIFNFTPAANEKYKFIATVEGLKSKSFVLPKAKEAGINLQAEHLNEKELQVRMISNLKKGNLPPNTTYAFIAHSGGKVIFSHEFDLKNPGHTLIVPKSVFPSGVVHLTLFNYRLSPISERLVFINHYDQVELSVSSKGKSFNKRQKITAGLNLKDKENKILQGSFSLAVVKEDAANNSENILSHLLLSSDLKGNIENPNYYFSEKSNEKEHHLDLLLLSQGWKRFEWPEVFMEDKVRPLYDFQRGIAIGGKITREFFALPLSDIKVTLTILNEYNDVFITRSGPDGSFMFDNLYYNDTMQVKIEAVKPNGRKNLVIVIEDDLNRQVSNFNYQTEQLLRKPGEHGRWINLPGEETEEVDDDMINRIHSPPNSSNVIIMDKTLRHYQSVAQILQGRVPGVVVSGNSVTIRGPSSFYLSNEPLFLIDGVPADASSAMQMSPYDIERIEVLKGAEASIYGLRGGNGVIAIYTLRGTYMIKGVYEFEMLGFITPDEFYSPRYDINRDEEFEDSRTTLLWIPNIELNESGEVSFEFWGSDQEGGYSIYVEGISLDGKPCVGYSDFKLN